MYSNFFKEFLKDPTLVLYSSSCTPLLSLLSYLIQQQTINSMLMILNFSFSALDFSHYIAHLVNTLIANVSNWMSSNFLSLNPSKTEFLIFGLPQQLSELHNSTIHLPNNIILSPVDSARSFGVIFDKNLSFAQHIYAVFKSCFHNIRDLRCIPNTIDQTTACTIATHPLSFTLILTFVTLFYAICLLHERIVFNLSLTLLLVLSPKLLNFTTLLLF